MALPVTMGPHDCPLQPSHSRRLEVYMSLAPGSGLQGMVLSGQRCVFCLKTLGLHSSFQETHSHLQARAQVFSGRETHVLQH